MYYQHIELAITPNKLKFEQMEDSKPLTLNVRSYPSTNLTISIVLKVEPDELSS
jgi:hypothetical protein